MGSIAFVLGSITIVVWDTKVCTSFGQAMVTLIGHLQLPIWAYLLSLLIAIVYLVPVGMLQAITNQQVGLKYVSIPGICPARFSLGHSVITELVVGYCLPERPVAMMIFKTFGYISTFNTLISDEHIT